MWINLLKNKIFQQIQKKVTIGRHVGINLGDRFMSLFSFKFYYAQLQLDFVYILLYSIGIYKYKSIFTH